MMRELTDLKICQFSCLCDKFHQIKDVRQLTHGMAYDNFIAVTNSFTEKPS